MEEHISSMRDAHQKYKDAWSEVLDRFSTATGQHNNDLDMDLAILSLHEQLEHFILKCEQLGASIDRDLIDEAISWLRENQQRYIDYLREVLAGLNVADNNDLAIPNLNKPLESFILALKNFSDYVESEVVIHIDTVDPNAIEAASVSPDNAQPRDMESDTRYGDEAEVSDEHKTAVSQDTAKFDLNSEERQDLAEFDLNSDHKTTVSQPELEETVEHKTVASQVLSDLDMNEKA